MFDEIWCNSKIVFPRRLWYVENGMSKKDMGYVEDGVSKGVCSRNVQEDRVYVIESMSNRVCEEEFPRR